MTEQEADAVFEMGMAAYSRVYLRTALRNLPLVARNPTVTVLHKLFADVPAILVAAGPSLDKNVEQLRHYKGRAVLIGINQSLRAMRAAGVEPDICLAIDPLNMSYHFDGKPTPVLGVCPSVASEVWALGEKTFSFPAARDTEGWLYDAMGVPQYWHVGNSVAHHAFHLAMHLGCNPVVIVGQDLALNGQQYYARNAGDGGEKQLVPEGDTLSTKEMYDRAALAQGDERHFDAVQVDDTLKLREVPGWGGAAVTTTTDLLPMLSLYGRMAKAASTLVRVINATEGGARIDGTEEVPLASVEANTKPFFDVDVAGKLAAALQPVDRRQALLKALKPIRRNLEKLGEVADNMLARTQRGPSAARDAFARTAAECLFFQLWCFRELRAIGSTKQAHPIHCAALEADLYRAAKLLSEEVGEKLRQASKGLAKAEKSPSSPMPQVMTNTL